MSERHCHKDDDRIPYLCSCKDCCRVAAAAWHGYMERVMYGELSLDEANRLADSHPCITPRPHGAGAA